MKINGYLLVLFWSQAIFGFASTPIKISVTAFEGKVTIKAPDGKETSPSKNADIPVGSAISTAEGGWVELVQGNLATLRIKSNTATFKIEESSFDETTRLSSSVFKLDRGTVLVHANPHALAEGSKYRVEMPELIANIHDSEAEMVSWAKGSAIKNVKGRTTGSIVHAGENGNSSDVNQTMVALKGDQIPEMVKTPREVQEKIVKTPKEVHQRIRTSIVTMPLLNGAPSGSEGPSAGGELKEDPGARTLDALNEGETAFEKVSPANPIRIRIAGTNGHATIELSSTGAISPVKGGAFPMGAMVGVGNRDWVDLVGSAVINFRNHLSGSGASAVEHHESPADNETAFTLKGDQIPRIVLASMDSQQDVKATLVTLSRTDHEAVVKKDGESALEDVSAADPIKIRVVDFGGDIKIEDPKGKSMVLSKGEVVPKGSRVSMGPAGWIDLWGSAIINVRDHIMGPALYADELAKPIEGGETMFVLKDQNPGIMETTAFTEDVVETPLLVASPPDHPPGGGLFDPDPLGRTAPRVNPPPPLSPPPPASP